MLSNTLSFSLSTWKLYCSLILSKSLFLFPFGFKSEQRRIFQSLLRKSFTFALTQPQGSETSVFFFILFSLSVIGSCKSILRHGSSLHESISGWFISVLGHSLCYYYMLLWREIYVYFAWYLWYWMTH